MTLITSPSNPRISKVRALQTARGRKKSGLFLMEGPNLFEALLAAQIVPYEVYYQPELLFQFQSLAGVPPSTLIEVSERVIKAISDTQTSQGIVCVLPLNALDHTRIQARRGP